VGSSHVGFRDSVSNSGADGGNVEGMTGIEV
jgi:hypothetical protein